MPAPAHTRFYIVFMVSFLSVFLVFFGAGTQAQDMPFTKKQTLEGAPKQQATGQVERYLNNLQTFAARFEQTVAGNATSTGAFYFKKPGRFLWHYLQPEPAKLVSSGGTIYFHDETSNQTTQVPRKGLADLLTRREIDLSGENFNVEDVYKKGGLLYVTIGIADVAEGDIGGQLQLTFLQNPMQLRQITTINQMGQPVEVLFYNIRENKPVPDDVFDFTPFHYREN